MSHPGVHPLSPAPSFLPTPRFATTALVHVRLVKALRQLGRARLGEAQANRRDDLLPTAD